MKQQKNQAFTLVELIIVVTILAILTTIWFMNYQSYTVWVRDGKRKWDLSEIRKWLDMYQATYAKLPEPDAKVLTIYSWGTDVYSYQWYLWETVQKSIKAWNTIKDDKDKTYYTYALDKTKTKYQILAMLEQDPAVIGKLDLAEEVYAVDAIDYTYRYPYTIWSKVWVMMSWTTNLPLQETLTTNTWTLILSAVTSQLRVDLPNTSSTTLTWSSVVTYVEAAKVSTWTTTTSWWVSPVNWACWSSNWQTLASIPSTNLCIAWTASIVSWTWPWTWTCNWSNWWTTANCSTILSSWWKNLDSNCNQDDYIFTYNSITYTWAWCNSTLWVWTDSNAFYYNNNPTSNSTAWNRNVRWWTKADTWDWLNWKFYQRSNFRNNCKWWDLWSSNPNSSCPCPSWWKVPTVTEWNTLFTYLQSNNSNALVWSPYVWWSNPSTNIYIALKMPLYAHRWSSIQPWARHARLTSTFSNDSTCRMQTIWQWDSNTSPTWWLYVSQPFIWDCTTSVWWHVRCIKE